MERGASDERAVRRSLVTIDTARERSNRMRSGNQPASARPAPRATRERVVGSTSMPSLYAGLLGDSASRLPDALRRFHLQGAGGRASGHFTVVRGRGWLIGVLCALLRLPPAGEGVRVDLHVVVDGERERWQRRFGTLSTWWAAKDRFALGDAMWIAADLDKHCPLFVVVSGKEGLSIGRLVLGAGYPVAYAQLRWDRWVR